MKESPLDDSNFPLWERGNEGIVEMVHLRKSPPPPFFKGGIVRINGGICSAIWRSTLPIRSCSRFLLFRRFDSVKLLEREVAVADFFVGGAEARVTGRFGAGAK